MQKEYDVKLIKRSVLDMGERVLGGWDWIEPGSRVLLKPNLLKPSAPHEAVTTHPSLVQAVSEIIRERGATPIIADTPAGPYTEWILRRLYQRCGMTDAASSSGALLNYDTTASRIQSPSGRLIRQFRVIRPLTEVDHVINLPKAKTHSFTFITGAVKNLFGLVPGLDKAAFHANLRDPRTFSEMLLDLAEAVNPTLTIMDAIVGMEGDGPSAGRIRRLSVLLGGRSPAWVDWALCRLIQVDPLEVPAIAAAGERGLIAASEPQWDLGQHGFEELAVSSFQLPQTMKPFGGLGSKWLSKLLLGTFKGALSLRPHIPSGRCTSCGMCVESCPVDAMMLTPSGATIDHGRCIRCFCCHEICPEKVVELRGSLAYRLLRPLSGSRA
jgi:uncharacterized protein (DUF362 family)/NAD-dependent dihydropyrimidine dehydrogenase PreA subunit